MNEILDVPAMLCSEISHKDRHSKHRERRPNCPTHSPFSALVARPVKKKEISNEPEAQAAVMKEWNRLKEKKVWLEHLVREWPDVAKEARIGGTTAHVGRVFMICVERGPNNPSLMLTVLGTRIVSSRVGPSSTEDEQRSRMRITT